jgi:hypothetical protein
MAAASRRPRVSNLGTARMKERWGLTCVLCVHSVLILRQAHVTQPVPGTVLCRTTELGEGVEVIEVIEGDLPPPLLRGRCGRGYGAVQ